jgi:hypothetical protein
LAGRHVVLEFPGVTEAKDWYSSSAYREILPLRTNHIQTDAIIVEGVEPGHKSAEMAARLRQQAATTG